MAHSKKVDLIIDLQYGSTGKGLIAGWLANQVSPDGVGYDTVINANMPNAGHTYIDKQGRIFIHKVFPNGVVSPKLKRIMIGPGSVFCPNQMIKEYEQIKDLLEGVRIIIHPNAVPLMPEHRKTEEENLRGISSTMQGSAAARTEKMMRDVNKPVIARDAFRSGETVYHQISEWVCTHIEWMEALAISQRILAEGAQGYSLGIDQKFYPFTTSRNCTPAQFLADMGIPLTMLKSVIGTARTYPIRVGSLPDGYSGDHYFDQEELSWADIGIEPEKTTVTQRERRIFSFSDTQMADALFECQPDYIFLNFVNYLDPKTAGHMANKINDMAALLVGDHSRVAFLGVGATHDDVIIVDKDGNMKQGI